MKKRITAILVLFIILMSCSTKSDQKYLIDKIDSLTIYYNLSNNLLQDTLKIKGIKELPFIEQYWENGHLKDFFVVDKIKRKLRYTSNVLPDSSIEVFYTDINDTSYKTFPFNATIAKFFDKHKELSVSQIRSGATTPFYLLNIPVDFVAIGVPANDSTRINKIGDNFSIRTLKKNGDTIPFTFFYAFCNGYQSTKALKKVVK